MNGWSEFWASVTTQDVTLESSLFRLALSLLLGVMIGAERKRKGQVAGMRTFGLISMGACMAMLISIYVPQEYLGLKNGDPGRIAAQVITGVGFLGGGAMIHLKGAVRGLTTAAGIWMTSIMGMGVGVGMYGIATSATIMSLLVLQGFDVFEQWKQLGQYSRIIKLSVDGIITDISAYHKIFEEHHIHVSTFYLTYDYEHSATEISFVVLAPSRVNLFDVFPALREAAPTRALSMANPS